MRTLICLLFALGVLADSGFGEKRGIVAGEDSLPFYENKTRTLFEKSIFELRAGEEVRLLEEANHFVRIEGSDGRKGWVERKFITSKGESDAISMKEIQVQGYLDNVDPVYILDFDNGEYRPLRVNKDFIHDPLFMLNVDRENFEWENEIYYYKGVTLDPRAEAFRKGMQVDSKVEKEQEEE